MGKEWSTEGRISQMGLPKRVCVEESRGNFYEAGTAGGGRSLQNVTSDDVVFYVGQSRKVYNVSAESLVRSSAYFKSMMSKRRGAPLPPVVMDCEESVFEGLLLLMRYGAWEALPPLSQPQSFRLKKEAELYGVQYLEPPKTPDSRSPTSSPGGSPTSATDTRRPPPCRRLSGRQLSVDGVRLSGCTSRQLAELPDFPLDLADPTKLLLVTCLDEQKAPIYACDHCSARPGGAQPHTNTQWGLSFHYRHAFCTGCGRPPTKLAPKLFAEMFTGAAAQYSQSTSPHELLQAGVGGAKPHAAVNWWVGSDSTCLLRLVSSPGSGPDACSSAGCAHLDSTVWAATFFYSHAFCTHCRQAAHGPALLSLLLALRYGGSTTKGSSKSSRSSFKIPTPPLDC